MTRPVLRIITPDDKARRDEALRRATSSMDAERAAADRARATAAAAFFAGMAIGAGVLWFCLP